jgi:hypothetical protein
LHSRESLSNFVEKVTMPKIFEYLGILIFFYSNEHELIHVHGKCDGCESKAEFYIVDGRIVQKWIDYFVYHKDIEFEKINTRIK